jgi:hypothetical protein
MVYIIRAYNLSEYSTAAQMENSIAAQMEKKNIQAVAVHFTCKNQYLLSLLSTRDSSQ